MTDTLAASAESTPSDPAADGPEFRAPEAIEPELAAPTEEELRRADRLLRRRRRRRLMLWGAVPALVMLLAAAKLLSMTIIGGQVVAQYEHGDYEESMNTSELLKTANIIEPWKAHYDVGTNALQLGLLDAARAELERGLELASPGEQCPIRNNLGIAIERQGDAALADGDQDTARARWEEALAVVDASDPSCPQTTSGPALAETRERIWRKLNPPDPSQGSGQQSQQDQGSSQDQQNLDQQGQSQQGQDQTAQEQLEQQMQQNEQQRQQELGDEQQQGGGGGTDTPW